MKAAKKQIDEQMDRWTDVTKTLFDLKNIQREVLEHSAEKCEVRAQKRQHEELQMVSQCDCVCVSALA